MDIIAFHIARFENIAFESSPMLKRCPRTIVITALLCMIVASATPQAEAQISAEKVNRAIKSGILFLKNHQKFNGDFATYQAEPGGACALCTLALLNAGVPKDDPVIVKALRYLRTIGPNRTYATSLRTMVFCKVDPDAFRPVIREHVKWLVGVQHTRGPSEGGWGYSRGGMADNSNSQYALLALHEAQKAGFDIHPSVWQLALNYWMIRQNKDSGGFAYRSVGAGTGSMTCAGISSLIIAYENLQSLDGVVNRNAVNCCGARNRSEEVERAIEKAIDWMGKKFKAGTNPGKNYFVYYYLYGMERAGRLSGRRFFGKHDWYREGAEWLVEQQKLNGTWTARAPAPEADPAIGTAFALLFLAKGRRPVLMAKYRYGDTMSWDGHRKGVHFLVRSIEKSWKRDLTWLTADSRLANVNDLLESPIQFISGKAQLDLNDAQKKALKEYVNQGGFIFAEASDGDG